EPAASAGSTPGIPANNGTPGSAAATAPAAPGAPVFTPVPVIVTPSELRPLGASPVDALLAYADRLRTLSPAELTQEINAQADTGDAAQRQLRLAMALQTSRSPSNSIRAQVLLARVLAQTGSQA